MLVELGLLSSFALFLRFFIGVAAIVGGIETRAFKDNSGTRAWQPFHLAVTPFFQPAKMFGTFTKGFVPHRLKSIKILPAFGAGIFVGWHWKIAELQSRCVQKQNSSPPAYCWHRHLPTARTGHSLTLNVRYGTSCAIDEMGEQSGNCGACCAGLHDLSGRLRRGPPVFYPNPVSRRGLWPGSGFGQRPTGQRLLLGRRRYGRETERENQPRGAT